MRILSLSHNHLPDSRVEKAAYTAKKADHTVFFAGPKKEGIPYSTEVFEKIYSLPFEKKSNLGIPLYWGRLKRGLERILSECNPELIHAHNNVAGKLASEFEIPFVYDDHEYWSVSIKAEEKNKWYHLVTQPYKRWLYDKWEKELLEKASAIIVTCETVMEEHKKINDRVFVVPNFPLLAESNRIEIKNTEGKFLSSVYVGSDCSALSISPYRDVSGLIEIFMRNDIGKLTVIGDNVLSTKDPIFSLGFFPHEKMMGELTRHHIGLLPWKKHWLHRYKDPNKPYEYAHAGLLTLSVSDMSCTLKNLDFVKTFEEYEELLQLLFYYKNNIEEIFEMKPKIRQYALKNLVWEKNESKILEAYSRI